MDVSRRFATKTAGKFTGLHYRPGLTGSPILTDIVAFIECVMEAHYPGGDHTIFVGRVVACEVYGGKEPLLFYQGKYSRMERMALPITYLYGG